MTMISRGVEISIAGGGGEMVRGPISWSEPSSLYRHLPTTLTLVTHHLALHKPQNPSMTHMSHCTTFR